MQAGAENDILDDVVHRRANGSLSFFAANALFVTLITYIPNKVYPHPIIEPPVAAAVVLVSAFKWWVAGTVIPYIFTALVTTKFIVLCSLCCVKVHSHNMICICSQIHRSHMDVFLYQGSLF